MMRFTLILSMMILLTSCEEVVVEKVVQTYTDGSPKVVNIYNEDESIQIGYRSHHENGNVSMEGGFLDGERHGQWNSYFSDGGLWTVNNYDQGEFHGDYLMYNQNGSVRIRGHYVHGVQSGHWTVTDEDGNLVREDDFGTPQ